MSTWGKLHCQWPRTSLSGGNLGCNEYDVHELGSNEHTRILTIDFEGLVPHQAVDAQLRCHVELDEYPFALSVDQCICIHAKALHHSEGAGDSPVGHGPHNHMSG